MIITGIVAIASLTMSTTMEPNGILMLVTTASLFGIDIRIFSCLRTSQWGNDQLADQSGVISLFVEH
jgi:hypothetical protein